MREAQAHLVQTGRPAEQEYGPVAGYASHLVDRVPSRRGRFHRQVRAWLLLGLLFTCGGIWGLLAGTGDRTAYGALALGVSQLIAAGWEWKAAGKDATGHLASGPTAK